MTSQEFIVVVRGADGKEYEMSVPARQESDAERLITNLLNTLYSGDKVVSIKKP